MNQVIRVLILKDCFADGRPVRAGKYGQYLEDVAKKLIDDGDAEEIVTISSLADIKTAGPKLKPKEIKSKGNTKEEKADDFETKTE